MPTLSERIKGLFNRNGSGENAVKGKTFYYKIGAVDFNDFTRKMLKDYFDKDKLDVHGNEEWKSEHPSRTDIPSFPDKVKPEDMDPSNGKFVFEDSFWFPEKSDPNPKKMPIGTFDGITFVDTDAYFDTVSDHHIEVFQNVGEEEAKALLAAYNKNHDIYLESLDSPLHDLAVQMLESGELKPEATEKVKQPEAKPVRKAQSAARQEKKKEMSPELAAALKALSIRKKIQDKKSTVVMFRDGENTYLYGRDAHILADQIRSEKDKGKKDLFKTIPTIVKKGGKEVPGKGIFTATLSKEDAEGAVQKLSKDIGYNIRVMDVENHYKIVRTEKGLNIHRNNRRSEAMNKEAYYLPVGGFHGDDAEKILDDIKAGRKADALSKARNLSEKAATEGKLFHNFENVQKGKPMDDADDFMHYTPFILAENNKQALVAMIPDRDEKILSNTLYVNVYDKYNLPALTAAVKDDDYLKDKWKGIVYQNYRYYDDIPESARILSSVFEKDFIDNIHKKEADLAAKLGEGFDWDEERDTPGTAVEMERYDPEEHEDYHETIDHIRTDNGHIILTGSSYGHENISLSDFVMDVKHHDKGKSPSIDRFEDQLDDIAKEKQLHTARPFYYEVYGFIPYKWLPDDISQEYEEIKARTGTKGNLAAVRLADNMEPPLDEITDKLDLKGGDIGQEEEYISEEDDKYIITYQPGYVYDDMHPEMADEGDTRAFRRLSGEEVAKIIDHKLDTGTVTAKDYYKLPEPVKEIFRQNEKGKAILEKYESLKNKPSITLDEFYKSGVFEYTKEDLSKLSTEDLEKVHKALSNHFAYYSKELNESDAVDHRRYIYEERDRDSGRYSIVSDILSERQKKASEVKVTGGEKTVNILSGNSGRWHQEAQNEQRKAFAEGRDPASAIPKEEEKTEETHKEGNSLGDNTGKSVREGKEEERSQGFRMRR